MTCAQLQPTADAQVRRQAEIIFPRKCSSRSSNLWIRAFQSKNWGVCDLTPIVDSCFINYPVHFWISWKFFISINSWNEVWYHSIYKTSGLLGTCQQATSHTHSLPPTVFQWAVHTCRSDKKRCMCAVSWVVFPQAMCKQYFRGTRPFLMWFLKN